MNNADMNEKAAIPRKAAWPPEVARLKEALTHYQKIYGAPKIETGCIVSASDGTSVNAAVNGQALTGETDVQPTQSHQWHDQSELIAGETDDAR